MTHFQYLENYHTLLSLCLRVYFMIPHHYLNHQETDKKNTDYKLSSEGFVDELMLPYVQIHLKDDVFISMMFFSNFFTLKSGSDSYIDRR